MYRSACSEIHLPKLTWVCASAKLRKAVLSVQTEPASYNSSLMSFGWHQWLTGCKQIINAPFKHNSQKLQGWSLKTENSLSIFKGVWAPI